jgi:hypothetical protein
MDPRIRIHPKMSWIRNTADRDQGWKKFGSGIRDKNLGSATLIKKTSWPAGTPAARAAETAATFLGVVAAGVFSGLDLLDAPFFFGVTCAHNTDCRRGNYLYPTALWNRNYFLRFRFRLLKSFGSGSSSDFWYVTVPVPDPYLVPRPLKAVFKK